MDIGCTIDSATPPGRSVFSTYTSSIHPTSSRYCERGATLANGRETPCGAWPTAIALSCSVMGRRRSRAVHTILACATIATACLAALGASGALPADPFSVWNGTWKGEFICYDINIFEGRYKRVKR